MQIIEMEIIDEQRDEESGDAYYTTQVKIMEPGAAFGPQPDRKELKNKLKEKLNKGFNRLK